MIKGIFHQGSGIGNQLHRYIGTKVIALDKGEQHTMIAPELFKGKDFMQLDITPNEIKYKIEYPSGKVIPESYEGVYDGEFQGEESFMHRIDEVRQWLSVEPLDVPDDLCIIGFRGGEYVGVKDLFLPRCYWEEAITIMKDKYPNIRFEVHTDDVVTAQQFFPDFPCIHNPSINWRTVRFAKHLIIANSSFFILPALLGDAKEIIAPEFWAGYNKGYWQLEENQYKQFTYI